MTSPLAAVEPLLACSIRVMRNKTTLQDLLAAYPSLKQKSLASPPTLTDSERRVLLDLPDEDMETVNIKAVTTLSRDQLIETAVSDRSNLTLEEVALLRYGFWTENSAEEHHKISTAYGKTSQEGWDELLATRKPAYFPNEREALSIGMVEFWKRRHDVQMEKNRVAANLALPYAKDWIQYLYRKEDMRWGFVCLYDAAAQQLDAERLDDFGCHLGGFFSSALDYNGSKDIISGKWELFLFNSPNTAFAPTTTPVNENATISETEYQGGAIFRKAFQEILIDSQEYQQAEDVTAKTTTAHQYKNGIAAAGFLANTFLVIDPICIDSVCAEIEWFDEMRILAFEADFPVEGRRYAEGYQGFTWVRLDQLVYNFYELRLMKSEEVGMDEIWKAAQGSRHRAFISMDPEDSQSFTHSKSTLGFTRDSIIGKRWYAMRDARKEAEGRLQLE